MPNGFDKPTTPEGRNWLEERGVVIHEIKRLTSELEGVKQSIRTMSEEFNSRMTELKIEVVTLRTKSNIWSSGLGIISGAIAAAVVSLILRK